MLADRAEAGTLLAERLVAMHLAEPLVLALPRGGVPVGAEIAKRLNAPLDVAFVRKLGAPGEPELAIGAVADGEPPEIVLNAKLVQALALSEDYIAAAAALELLAIEQRRRDYEGVRPQLEPGHRTVIVVDDGVATGMTMQAALRQLRRRHPEGMIIAAVPVASREAAAMLRREADQLVCLRAPRRFGSVGSFYRSFAQVGDADVAGLLEQAAARMAG
jgi:putative phosphoribosyl transferase